MSIVRIYPHGRRLIGVVCRCDGELRICATCDRADRPAWFCPLEGAACSGPRQGGCCHTPAERYALRHGCAPHAFVQFGGAA